MKSRKNILIYLGIFAILFLLGFVLAKPQFDTGSRGPYFLVEDTDYQHNFTANLSTSEPPHLFTVLSINWSEDDTYTASDIYWINLTDDVLGLMNFTSSKDNETGRFNITMSVQNDTGSGDIETFFFEVNATNDAPEFVNMSSVFNLTQNQSFYDYLNATDQESHLNLTFNISFFIDNCSHASWSQRNDGENCSLFVLGMTLTDLTNDSAAMNFTPTKDDVGTYWANISVMDFGENYSCPHNYCDAAAYEQNQTTIYSVAVRFNVFASLDANITDCENKVFTENVADFCYINLTTQGEEDALNISSIALLRNYGGGVLNRSWFLVNSTTTSDNFTKEILINVTPQKTEIGNWTINFTVFDDTYGQNITVQIPVYVERNSSLNDAPEITDVANVQTSMDLERTISLSVYDNDLLIPDKNDVSGGYNETITFNATLFNQSDLSQALTIDNFTVTILSMPVLNVTVPTNQTTAEIRFTPNETQVGDYTVNLSVNDSENAFYSIIFNLTISSNTFPTWNQTNYSFDLTVNSTLATTDQFGPINLTGDLYVTDIGDVLTFTSSTAFPGFNLSSGGMVDFTPWKLDIGYWEFSVTANDSLGLENTTLFIFNVSNINTEPMMETPLSVNVNATVESNSNITTAEDNYTIITLWVQDEDLKVNASQKSYYNETLTVNLTIEGPNSSLFSFTKDGNFPTPGANRTRYTASFTPGKSDIGGYNVSINVTDISNASVFLSFNLTIIEISHNPVLMNLTNQSSGVNRTLYYNINASDTEDGDDSSGNLTYDYAFLSGTDFIGNNESIFNTTSGELDITFNDTQAGKYNINITVNDTDGSIDSQDFWVLVYGTPNITFPLPTYNFSLQENVTSSLIFRANHSVNDNLTYAFYLNEIYKYNASSYGNNTNLTWAFTPNFTDETYGLFENLSLLIYPATSDLANATDFNYTINWNSNITHNNSPVAFRGYIGYKQATYNSDIEIDLTQYFSDIDYTDAKYNQTVNFTISSNSSPTDITSSVSSDWLLTLSAIIAVTEMLNITASDINSSDNSILTSVTSNDFLVKFTEPETVTVTPSGGGGTTLQPVSLKIIMPDPVSAFKKDQIVLPITLQNDGKISLFGINLSGSVAKDGELRNDIILSFDKTYFSSLGVGNSEAVTLTADIDTDDLGTFEITINASVTSPKYHDWGKIYLTIQEGDKIQEKLLFIEEFIVENPECLELKELIEEAKQYAREGNTEMANQKAEEAINACREAIEQPTRGLTREVVENKLYRYLAIATVFAFFTGISYYSYRRIKLKRSALKSRMIVDKKEKIIKIKESI